MPPTEVLVVPHTHWDRAWYWPFPRMQVRLIQCMSEVLDLLEREPSWRFTCDGQVLMVEDFLAARPQERDRLAAHVRSGRLKVGPLYAQSDLYCTGPEAFIRNLQIGRRAAQALGASQRTLYLADTFGLPASIPAIARGFGIATVVFMRGMSGQVPTMTGMQDAAAAIPRQVPEGTRRFAWDGVDGSEVAVFHLRDGYANAAALGRAPDDRGIEARYVPERAVEQLRAAAARQHDAEGPPLLLLAGVDHQLPQPGLPAAMAAASDARWRFRAGDLDELSDELMRQDRSRWPRYIGEFHGSGAASVLGGTISARIHLKLENARAERLLTDQVEPALALARLSGVSEPSESAVGVAWRHLLTAHPHDDICGCSVDAVHRDTEHHITQALIGGDALRRRVIRQLCQRFGGAAPEESRVAMLLYNAQALPRSGPTCVRLDLEGRRAWGDYALPERYAVVDERGARLPFRELERGPCAEHPHQVLSIELHGVLAPTTLTRVYIEPVSERPRARGAVTRVLENEHLRATVGRDGTITLADRASGLVLRGLGAPWDQGDPGDSNDFNELDERERPLPGPVSIQDGGGRDGLQAVRIERVLSVSEGLEAGSTAARSRRRVRMPWALELALAPGSRHLECVVAFTNAARDHRLRWNLPLPFAPGSTRAGTWFSQVERPASPQPDATPPRIHPEHPADRLVAVSEREGAGRGLAVFTSLPVNYELVTGERPRLEITVLRAVGMLTRLGLTTRTGAAGPTTPTPEAQCLGRSYAMRFALRPYAQHEEGGLLHEAALWRAEPLAGQIEHMWNLEAPRGEQGPHFAADGEVVVSACAPRQDGPGGGGALVQSLRRGAHPHPAPSRRLAGLGGRPRRAARERLVADGRWSGLVPARAPPARPAHHRLRPALIDRARGRVWFRPCRCVARCCRLVRELLADAFVGAASASRPSNHS